MAHLDGALVRAEALKLSFGVASLSRCAKRSGPSRRSTRYGLKDLARLGHVVGFSGIERVGVGCLASDEGTQRAGAPAQGPPSTEGRLTGGDSRLAFLRAILAAARDPRAVAALAAGTGRALDGEALRQLIERERVGPLLHRALNRSGMLSPATCAALRDSYRATAMRNLVFLNELDGCLERLAAAGVAAIVLKGSGRWPSRCTGASRCAR